MNQLINLHMSHLMRKPTICICDNKGADQLHGYREADQRLCFPTMDSAIPFLSKVIVSKISSILPSPVAACAAGFVSDLVGNHIVGFLVSPVVNFELSHEKSLLTSDVTANMV